MSGGCLLIWLIFIIFLCAVVIEIHIGFSEHVDMEDYPLWKAFNNPNDILKGVFCSLLVTSTMFLELLLDFIFQSDSVNDQFERSMLVFVVLLSGCSILNAHGLHAPHVFACWHLFHFMGSLAPVYSLCCRLVPEHFSGYRLSISYLFWVSGGLISLIGFGNPSLWQTVTIAICGFFSQLIFLFALFGWLKSLYNKVGKTKSIKAWIKNIIFVMSEDEFCLMLYIVAALPILVGFFCLISASRKFFWVDGRHADLLAGIYLLIAFSVFTSCIPGRAKQYASKMQKQKIVAGHATVRYISHEIRSPLNIVKNGIKLVIQDLKGNCSKDIIDSLLDVEHASDTATSIVDDLLNFEKIESGTFSVDRKHVPASACLTKIVKSCGRLAQQKGIQFRINDSIETAGYNLVYAIDVDYVKLEQVIRNLIVNSIKFTPTGGFITISLTHCHTTVQKEMHSLAAKKASFLPFKYMHMFVSILSIVVAFVTRLFVRSRQNQVCASAEGNTTSPLHHICGSICVEVSDTGVGMTREQTKNVFGQFVQFDPNRLQGGGGSGLGLWICKEIIKQHDGAIRIQSEGVGQGTTVTLQLNCFTMPTNSLNDDEEKTLFPLEDDPKIENLVSVLQYDIACKLNSEVQPEKSLSPSCTPDITQSIDTVKAFNCREKTVRILAVDDSSLNRKVLLKMIRRIVSEHKRTVFCQFYEADDGIAAIKAVENCVEAGGFDAIFIDNIMPAMNGPQAAEKIRNQYNYTGRIIGVTGNALDSDVSDFKTSGANSVLIKPVCWEALKGELEAIESLWD